MRRSGPRTSQGDDGNHLVVRHFRMTVSRGFWPYEISRRHPDTIFEITNWTMRWAKGRSLADVQVYGPGTWDCVKEIRSLKDVYFVEDGTAAGSVRDLRIIHKTPPMSSLFRQLKVVQKPPFMIKNGVASWDVVGTESEIQRMVRGLHNLSIELGPDPSYGSQGKALPVNGAGSRAKSAVPLLSEGKGSSRLAYVKTHFSMPPASWHYIMTTRHPETSLEVLGYSQLDGKTIMDIRVNTRDIASWIDELRSLENIIDVEPFVKSRGAMILRVLYKEVGIISTTQRLNLLLRTPFTITDGVTVLSAAGPEANIKRFIKMFPLQVKVDAVYNAERDEGAILTPRQADIFRRAMDAGYFEVPRRVTLTELAGQIGVAVSSLSEILAVVEKKLLEDSSMIRQ